MKTISKAFTAMTLGIALSVFTMGIANAVVPVFDQQRGTTVIIKVNPLNKQHKQPSVILPKR